MTKIMIIITTDSGSGGLNSYTVNCNDDLPCKFSGVYRII